MEYYVALAILQVSKRGLVGDRVLCSTCNTTGQQEGVGLRGQKAQLAGCRRGGQLEIWSNWKNPKLENPKKHLRRKGWRDAEKNIGLKLKVG